MAIRPYWLNVAGTRPLKTAGDKHGCFSIADRMEAKEAIATPDR